MLRLAQKVKYQPDLIVGPESTKMRNLFLTAMFAVFFVSTIQPAFAGGNKPRCQVMRGELMCLASFGWVTADHYAKLNSGQLSRRGPVYQPKSHQQRYVPLQRDQQPQFVIDDGWCTASASEYKNIWTSQFTEWDVTDWDGSLNVEKGLNALVVNTFVNFLNNASPSAGTSKSSSKHCTVTSRLQLR